MSVEARTLSTEASSIGQPSIIGYRKNGDRIFQIAGGCTWTPGMERRNAMGKIVYTEINKSDCGVPTCPTSVANRLPNEELPEILPPRTVKEYLDQVT